MKLAFYIIFVILIISTVERRRTKFDPLPMTAELNNETFKYLWFKDNGEAIILNNNKNVIHNNDRVITAKDVKSF
jgi:hypothetical protein